MQSSTELTVLGWSVVLLLVHIVVQTLALIRGLRPELRAEQPRRQPSSGSA